MSLPRKADLGDGWIGRLLSAREELEAWREGEELASGEDDRALCSNACLLAKALLRDGAQVFQSGEEVLEGLTAGQIEHLARKWREFDRECDPAPWDEKAVDEAKKAWSARLMNACNGVCSRLLGHCPQRSGRRK